MVEGVYSGFWLPIGAPGFCTRFGASKPTNALSIKHSWKAGHCPRCHHPNAQWPFASHRIIVKETRSYCPGVASLLEPWQPPVSFYRKLKSFPWDSLSPFMLPTKCWACWSKREIWGSCWKNEQAPRNSSQQSQCLPQNCKLNSASLLLEPDLAALVHNCAEITDEVYSSRIDL